MLEAGMIENEQERLERFVRERGGQISMAELFYVAEHADEPLASQTRRTIYEREKLQKDG